jgi:hypothetical protein
METRATRWLTVGWFILISSSAVPQRRFPVHIDQALGAAAQRYHWSRSI